MVQGKMADEVWEGIENALNTIVTTTERSGNVKKELKHTISETLSTLRKLFVKLKDISYSKSRAISELETAVTKMKAEHEDGRNMNNTGRAAPSLIPSQEPAGRRAKCSALPGDRKEELYSEALGNSLTRNALKSLLNR
jgi:hypothetical protein